MYNLPPEILHKIAHHDEQTYRGMLSFPLFARSVDVSTKLDYMIHFGHDIKITANKIIWRKNCLLHRAENPAVEYLDGSKEWYQNGEIHRTDGPAVERPNGYRAWHQNGGLHREGGPARTWKDGSEEWWQNGKLHRIGGPAAKYSNGSTEWWQDGKRIASTITSTQ